MHTALRDVMRDAHLTPAALAERVGVSEKSVRNWLSGKHRPFEGNRLAVCAAVGAEEAMVFPELLHSTVKIGLDREIAAVYPTLSTVPDTTWRRLFTDAHEEIMLCGFAPHWLSWRIPNLVDILRSKAEAGCRVRIVVGDPDNLIVHADEDATGAPVTLTARIAQTEQLFASLLDVAEMRRTMLGFGRSVYRGDNAAIIDWWLAGQPGADFPAMRLRRRVAGGLFDQTAVRHADAVWASGTPVTPS